MALDFPSSPTDNYVWKDGCGNEWVYTSATNSWHMSIQGSGGGGGGGGGGSKWTTNSGNIFPTTTGTDLLIKDSSNTDQFHVEADTGVITTFKGADISTLTELT